MEKRRARRVDMKQVDLVCILELLQWLGKGMRSNWITREYEEGWIYPQEVEVGETWYWQH
ncbi:hypothetical protein H5410_031734 [Solanum commersonii]|uniref:Uncharacterized protein n=1 Tax=Solanum commersonii TaxID=4109 RepID=A0A9J5YMK9_SOLCO|nr:hypothetical protein H5410_031734 [Solanum commersonii]